MRWVSAPCAVALAVGLASCRPPVADMSEDRLGEELQRCRQLGVKTYDDATCRAALKERTRRFFGESAEPGR